MVLLVPQRFLPKGAVIRDTLKPSKCAQQARKCGHEERRRRRVHNVTTEN
jgi:hypothetical protein